MILFLLVLYWSCKHRVDSVSCCARLCIALELHVHLAPQDMDGAPHFGSWETFTAVDVGSGQAGPVGFRGG